MTHTCKECGDEFETDSHLNTHVLLKHPELARSNSEDYAAEEHDTGNVDPRYEKGEQFGYR